MLSHPLCRHRRRRRRPCPPVRRHHHPARLARRGRAHKISSRALTLATHVPVQDVHAATGLTAALTKSPATGRVQTPDLRDRPPLRCVCAVPSRGSRARRKDVRARADGSLLIARPKAAPPRVELWWRPTASDVTDAESCSLCRGLRVALSFHVAFPRLSCTSTPRITYNFHLPFACLLVVGCDALLVSFGHRVIIT